MLNQSAYHILKETCAPSMATTPLPAGQGGSIPTGALLNRDIVTIKNKPSIAELIEQIERSRGNVSQVARLYGRPRSTVQSWIDNSKTAVLALDDARETRVDVAEMVVYKAAAEENLSGAFYILNNDPKAKKRGWGPRLDLAHSGEVTTVTRIVEKRSD